MKIEIIKEKRKTMVLKVLDEEHAVLKAPKSFSDAKIKTFLDSKAKWLQKTYDKLKSRDDLAAKFDFDSFVYLDGKQMMSVNEIAFDFSKLSESAKRKAIKNYYKTLFVEVAELAENLSAETGLKFKELKMTNSVRVWGSYSSNGVMKLNWKLLILPRKLSEYVIFHELCHSRHMNHKPQFWRAVEKVCPDYKLRKKTLNDFSFVLRHEF